MTCLPQASTVKLGLVIDLDTCVGCHACAVACKQWNDGGQFGPLSDGDERGAKPSGVWFNRVHSYEAAPEPVGPGSATTVAGARLAQAQAVYFPRSCLHCETPDCVTVCPTGASYKRAEDGIVLVDADQCIGCKLCSWACPYGAREYDADAGVIKKCTLCVDRIYNPHIEPADRVPACVQACPTKARHFGDLGDPESAVSVLVAERNGHALMPELGYQPVNRYLPPRPRQIEQAAPAADAQETLDPAAMGPLLRWIDRVLSR